MTEIDKGKPVLVTGATGFVAGWLVKKLLENGLTVHAAVRNPENKKKIEHLDRIAAETPGTIKYYKADLLQAGSYAEAMEGCELIYHTASPFTSNFKDPQKELIDPAVKGTKNVLEQATHTSSVKRVVVTSSCASIYCDATDLKDTPKGMFTEDVWNTKSSLEYQPYSYSKTLAEKEAWKIAKAQSKWDLVVVNPSFVMGPALNANVATSESMTLLKQMGDGSFKMGAPNLGVGVVDVRDLATAHFNAGFTPQAHGRNIISAHNSSFVEMAQLVHSEFGDKFPVPNKPLPKWLLLIVGPMVNKALSRKFIRNNVNQPWKADNSKSIESLGMQYRPLQETMIDGFRELIDAGILKPKK